MYVCIVYIHYIYTYVIYYTISYYRVTCYIILCYIILYYIHIRFLREALGCRDVEPTPWTSHLEAEGDESSMVQRMVFRELLV